MTTRPAFGYLRTSSATNVGGDKDSDKRQRAAIEAGAASMGFNVKEWFYDAAVSGDDPIEDRPGFLAMLDAIETNGVRDVVVEGADRFARKMLTAELGIVTLIARGVTLWTASGENLTDTTDEMRVAFRQIAMTFAQLEKTRLVKKLRAARDRKSDAAGFRIEGPKPDAAKVQAAQALAAQGMSLRAVAARLAQQGILTAAGEAVGPAQVRKWLKRPAA
jgi:DNA invertase Pin-like site-specific DNA recombinase